MHIICIKAYQNPAWNPARIEFDRLGPFGLGLGALRRSGQSTEVSGWLFHIQHAFKYTISIITSQLHCFQLRATLNGKDFKIFFSWAMNREAEHPPSTHAEIILDFDQ